MKAVPVQTIPPSPLLCMRSVVEVVPSPQLVTPCLPSQRRGVRGGAPAVGSTRAGVGVYDRLARSHSTGRRHNPGVRAEWVATWMSQAERATWTVTPGISRCSTARLHAFLREGILKAVSSKVVGQGRRSFQTSQARAHGSRNDAETVILPRRILFRGPAANSMEQEQRHRALLEDRSVRNR